MCKHPRLQRRGGVYWFRCRIPADLIAHYGKREILKSLKTSDAQEAFTRCAKLLKTASLRGSGAMVLSARHPMRMCRGLAHGRPASALSREWVRDADDDSMRFRSKRVDVRSPRWRCRVGGPRST